MPKTAKSPARTAAPRAAASVAKVAAPSKETLRYRTTIAQIEKRDGRIVPFDFDKIASVVEKHSHDSRDPVDLPDDDLKTFLELLNAGFAIQQILGTPTYHPHRRADLVSEARGQGADGRQSIRMLEASFEFQLAPMPLHKVRTGLGKLLIQAAKLLAQEFDFVATDTAA